MCTDVNCKLFVLSLLSHSTNMTISHMNSSWLEPEMPFHIHKFLRNTYTACFLTVALLYFCIVFCFCFFTEPTLERGPKHFEVGCIPFSQPCCSRRCATLLQFWVLQLTRNCLHTHIQQLFQRAAREDSGLPLWHLRGWCPTFLKYTIFTILIYLWFYL